MNCQYTDLLKALLDQSEQQERKCTNPHQKAEWREVNRAARLELYRTHGFKKRKTKNG